MPAGPHEILGVSSCEGITDVYRRVAIRLLDFISYDEVELTPPCLLRCPVGHVDFRPCQSDAPILTVVAVNSMAEQIRIVGFQGWEVIEILAKLFAQRDSAGSFFDGSRYGILQPLLVVLGLVP